MATYRKKPATVEATQFFVEGDHPDVLRHPSPTAQAGFMFYIKGEHGFMRVLPGDFIVSDGESVFPVHPEEFAQTYEAVPITEEACWMAQYRDVKKHPATGERLKPLKVETLTGKEINEICRAAKKGNAEMAAEWDALSGMRA
jgi:hypothetical protein